MNENDPTSFANGNERSRLELRDATESDRNFLRELYRTTREDEVAQFGWSDEQVASFLDMQGDVQSRSYAMQYPDAQHKIILWDGSSAGRIMTEASDNVMLLIDIAVLPAFRGRAIASTLIKRLQVGSEVVRLSVAKTNQKARALYERHGFTVSGESEFNVSMQWKRPSE